MISTAARRGRIVIKIWLDGFFVAVERRSRPELQARPLIVGGGRGDRGRVAACSREASLAGVEVGQPLADAYLRCPDGVFLAGEISRYVDAWRLVDQTAAASVGAVRWISLHEGVVGLYDVTLAHACALADALFRDVRERLGLGLSCGVATGRPAAAAAARLAAPCGVLAVFPGYDARFLAPLAIESLEGLTRATLTRLHAAAIDTIGQIASASPDVLANIVGRSAHVVRALASGEDLWTSPRPAARRVTHVAPPVSAGLRIRAML